MSAIQDMMEEMRKTKFQEKKEYDKISWKKELRTRDTIKRDHLEKLENKEVTVALPNIKSKEEVYKEIKDIFRMAWKGSGYVNKEFSKIPTLKGKILNEWEIERVNLAERSCKAPEGFKGFKIPSQYLEFPRPLTPVNYREHLKEFRVKFDDYVQRPTKYGKVHEDELLERVIINNKEPFRLVNSVQSNSFGLDVHRTWEAELSRKGLKTK